MPSATKVQLGYVEAINPFSLANGTASAPAITFTSSTATGMFSPSTGALAFSTGSTQNALTILSDGNVGIGITDPSVSLHVNGGTYVSGSVGIGTTNPISKLDVFGGSLRVYGTTSPSLIIVPTSGSSYIFGANTSITGGGIYDNTSGIWRLVVKDTTGNILIGSRSETGTASQRLQVTGGAYVSDNLGIGRTNPGTFLEVSGTGSEQFRILGSGGGYFFAGYDNTNNRARIGSFKTETGWTNLLINEGGGNVGIGITNPGCSLQVNGGIRARGGAPGALGISNNGYAFSGGSGDNDSGMFSSADGQLEFYSNNNEELRITPSRTSAYNQLLVDHPRSGGNINWYDRALIIQENTSQPAISFHAASAATAGIFKWEGTTQKFECRNSTDSGYVNLYANSYEGYGGALNNLGIFATSGGNEANLSTNFENRLNVNFTASGPRVIMIGNISIAADTGSANDFLLRLVIRDTTTSTDVVSNETIGSSAWALGGAANMNNSLAVSGLVVGRVYNARLDIRKTQNLSNYLPRYMRIDGICY